MFGRSSFKHFSDTRRRGPSALLADESGSATVETVLWLPMIFLVFGIAVDFSMVFFGKSQALRIVQDANRQASIGYLENAAAVKTYVESRLAGIAPSVVATPVFDSGRVLTSVSMPMGELEMLGLFRGFDNLNVVVSSEHMIEDWGS